MPREFTQMVPVGAAGAQLKQAITDQKSDRKAESFDPGAAMLGTDNEAGSLTDADEIERARKALQPPSQIKDRDESP